MSFLGRALLHLCEMRQSAKTANRLAAVPSIVEAQSIGPAGADKRVALAKGGACSDVRFGSKADMCGAKRYVRFAPESDRESRHPQKVMSALPLKADMCGAASDVC